MGKGEIFRKVVPGCEHFDVNATPFNNCGTICNYIGNFKRRDQDQCHSHDVNRLEIADKMVDRPENINNELNKYISTVGDTLQSSILSQS
jgi:hypothetical protein